MLHIISSFYREISPSFVFFVSSHSSVAVAFRRLYLHQLRLPLILQVSFEFPLFSWTFLENFISRVSQICKILTEIVWVRTRRESWSRDRDLAGVSTKRMKTMTNSARERVLQRKVGSFSLFRPHLAPCPLGIISELQNLDFFFLLSWV